MKFTPDEKTILQRFPYTTKDYEMLETLKFTKQNVMTLISLMPSAKPFTTLMNYVNKGNIVLLHDMKIDSSQIMNILQKSSGYDNLEFLIKILEDQNTKSWLQENPFRLPKVVALANSDARAPHLNFLYFIFANKSVREAINDDDTFDKLIKNIKKTSGNKIKEALDEFVQCKNDEERKEYIIQKFKLVDEPRPPKPKRKKRLYAFGETEKPTVSQQSMFKHSEATAAAADNEEIKDLFAKEEERLIQINQRLQSILFPGTNPLYFPLCKNVVDLCTYSTKVRAALDNPAAMASSLEDYFKFLIDSIKFVDDALVQDIGMDNSPTGTEIIKIATQYNNDNRNCETKLTAYFHAKATKNP